MEEIQNQIPEENKTRESYQELEGQNASKRGKGDRMGNKEQEREERRVRGTGSPRGVARNLRHRQETSSNE